MPLNKKAEPNVYLTVLTIKDEAFKILNIEISFNTFSMTDTFIHFNDL